MIVVGGGHNGLRARRTGRAGLKTLVLERRHLLGGAAVTEEVWPGFKVSTASYVVSLLAEDSRGARAPEARLPRLPARPRVLAPFPDGSGFLLWRTAPRGRGDREDQQARRRSLPGVQPRAGRARQPRAAASTRSPRPQHPLPGGYQGGAFPRTLRVRQQERPLAARGPDDHVVRGLPGAVLR